MTPYKNLIFDLGEVIIDIDYRQTIAAFQKLSVVDFSAIVSYTAQNPVFDLFEGLGGIEEALPRQSRVSMENRAHGQNRSADVPQTGGMVLPAKRHTDAFAVPA